MNQLYTLYTSHNLLAAAADKLLWSNFRSENNRHGLAGKIIKQSFGNSFAQIQDTERLELSCNVQSDKIQQHKEDTV